MPDQEKAMELSRSLVSKGDRQASSYGALFFSTPDMGCREGIKCVRRAEHSGACWPADKEN